MEKKLKIIFSQIFEINISQINDHSSSDNIERWDSLNHTNLIVALEQAFEVSFTADEIIDMLNFKQIRIILEQKLKVD